MDHAKSTPAGDASRPAGVDKERKNQIIRIVGGDRGAGDCAGVGAAVVAIQASHVEGAHT